MCRTGSSLRDRVRSSVTQSTATAPPHWGSVWISLGSLLCASLGRYSRHVPLAGGPMEELWRTGGTMAFGWPESVLGLPRENWRKFLGGGRFGHFCLDCCLHKLSPDKRLKMNVWNDERLASQQNLNGGQTCNDPSADGCQPLMFASKNPSHHQRVKIVNEWATLWI